MASISLPLPPESTSAFTHYLDSAGRSPRGHSRRNLTMSTPLPNPPFIFPARDPDATPQPSETTPIVRASLPAFSFNPGSTQSTQSTQPTLPTPPVNRAGGHRRRCSEFVGGEHLVSPGTVDAGQDNDENSAPAPTKLPAPGPGFSAGGPGRRRHAHRRSAAISSVDLTAITNALDTKPAVESAPCTTAIANRDSSTSDMPPRPISHSAASLGRLTPPASPQIMINGEIPSPPKPETPFRSSTVGGPFSEIESKDFGSMATTSPEKPARNSDQPDHSKSGPSSPTPTPRKIKPRPKTADASLMLDPNSFGTADDGSPMKRPLSSTGHSRFRKSMSSGMLDAALRKQHGMGEDSPWTDSSRHSSSDDGESETSVEDLQGSAGSPSTSKKKSKSKKRQKKVRSWAGAILTRGKGKRQFKPDPTDAKFVVPPPVLTRTNSDLGSGLDVDFDDDNIVVIRTPTNPTTPETRRASDDTNIQPSLESAWKPRSYYEQGTAPPDALSPIIDLDAALGPFNTPDMHSGRVPESGFSAATKRMYSGGRRGEFVGPEMRYHRRAESAPEMPPFDRSFLTNNRLPNTSNLENPDVFYEEEEDAFLAATSDSPTDHDERSPTQGVAKDDNISEESKESSDTLTRSPSDGNGDIQQTTGLGIHRNELKESSDSKPTSSPFAGSKPAEQPPSAADQLENAVNPFSNPPRSPVEVVKQDDWQRKTPVPPSPDISPRFLPADHHRPATSPLELTPNIPHLSLQGGSSVSNSSYPSPDFAGSSPDGPRSITTSSTTDRNFSNPSYNPSMDFPHASADDVPSLTSSASTTTNPLNRFSASFFHPRRSTDRSASFSAAVHRRTSQANAAKRSSLVSLSKLVAGPHSERSKLSHEEKPPSDEPEKSKKKGHRISRLMHFWRTKDKDRLNQNVVREERPS